MHVFDIAIVAFDAGVNYRRCVEDWGGKTWNAAYDWEREAAIEQVNLALKNPGSSPAELHDIWWQHMYRRGWRKGERVDYGRRLHPAYAPWDELAPEWQMVNKLFLSIVRTLAPTLERPACSSETSTHPS